MRSVAARALIRFHRAAGARVALRAAGIVGAILVFVYGSAPEALATLRAAILSVVARDHPWGSRAVLAGFCVALAGAAAPRVTLGTTGWMRSLPASAATHRRAAIIALTAAQALAMIFVVLFAIAAVVAYDARLSVTKLASVPVLMVASAVLVMPVRHRAIRLLPALAIGLLVRGTWPLAAMALVILVASDLLSGEIVRARQGPSLSRATPSVTREPALVAWMRMTWRTLPFGTVLGSVLLPAVFVAFGQLVVRRNPDLSDVVAARTIRICGSLALAALVATLGNALVRGRPPWSWSRSLPWSSTQRVVADAIVVGIPLVFVPLALVPVGALAALSVVAMVPAVAVATASALRVGASRQTGAAGEAVALTVMISAVVVLWPPACVAALALTPLLVRWGAARERDVLTSRWVELQHHAIGDPAWLDTP